MWAEIAAWFQSPDGARVLQTAIVPGLAILVAGVLAALISRAALRAALRRADRERAATAVAGLVEAARAAAESEGGRDRRRVARLRAEADVRVRLLPLRGADQAADWAEATTQALVAARADGAHASDVAVLRDTLVAWVRHPRRAKRLFSKPAATPGQATAAGQEQAAALSPAPPAASSAAADQPAVPIGAGTGDSVDEPDVPAWRRTRSVERLQQAQTARAEAELEAEETAPVRMSRPFRADTPAPAPSAELGAAAAPTPHRAPPPTTASATPSPEPAARLQPEWLDTYDDEAEVTQNLDLRTPPPVAATSVRDRAPSADIVPRP